MNRNGRARCIAVSFLPLSGVSGTGVSGCDRARVAFASGVGGGEAAK